MKSFVKYALLIVATAALNACGEKKEDAAQKAGAVGGKILERSISDDMLPYDTVRSQPPLADPEVAKAEEGKNPGVADSGASTSAANEADSAPGPDAAPSEAAASAAAVTPNEE